MVVKGLVLADDDGEFIRIPYEDIVFVGFQDDWISKGMKCCVIKTHETTIHFKDIDADFAECVINELKGIDGMCYKKQGDQEVVYRSKESASHNTPLA